MDNSKYNAKAKDSFKTKKKLFLFDRAINGGVISVNEFEDFTITEELVNIYSSKYWQYEKTDTIISIQIEEIYKAMKKMEANNTFLISELESNYVNNFNSKFPKETLEKLLSNTSCKYCGITVNEIRTLANKGQLFKKTERGWNLEIDRKNSNFEYTPDNCVMSCYWCNNAKTDEFNYDEFLIIGKVISSVWKKRLHDD